MSAPETTSWRLIEQAATGVPLDRAEFVRRYQTLVRAFLLARWRRTPFVAELDDATQEVFVECFRTGGVLGKADPERPGGFRALLFGVVRNVALRVERRRARRIDAPAADSGVGERIAAGGASPSQLFDQAWARAVLREAAAVQAEAARGHGADAQRRVELLRLRFHEGLPIRDIARQWQLDAAFVHHEYATARKEFVVALRLVIARQSPADGVDALLQQLLETLG